VNIEQSPQTRQPEDQKAWFDATTELISKAKSDTDELFEALNSKEIARLKPKHGPKIFKSPGPGNRAHLDNKIMSTKFAVDQADVAIVRVSRSLQRLQHERQTKWAALKVCEWRVALRQRRPPQECFQDHLQDALDTEKKVLEGSRKVLLKTINEGKAILEDCEATKAALVGNVRFMVTCHSIPVDSAAESDAADPGSLQDPSAVQSSPSKPDLPTDPEELLRRAPRLEQLVLSFGQSAEQLVHRHKKNCAGAHERVMASFQRRLTENEQFKTDLEQQIAEMENAISTAEKSLARMKKRIDHFQQVELQPKYDNASAVLKNLRLSKAALEEDFHRKLVSMKIDECCRKTTPEKCTGQKPEDMPAATLLERLELRAKKTGSMRRTSSVPCRPDSPAFSAFSGDLTDNSRPISPAGVSSPLKSAARASIGSTSIGS
jgi:hypothetical protein